jgi:putative ABC transport system substrate-binding protein
MGGSPIALAAKSVTATIPIIFGVSVNPVEAGLVGSLNYPGGNLTGVTILSAELFEKRVELLRELMAVITSTLRRTRSAARSGK